MNTSDSAQTPGDHQQHQDFQAEDAEHGGAPSQPPVWNVFNPKPGSMAWKFANRSPDEIAVPNVVPGTSSRLIDWSRPQAGTYFFYGTLQDPGVLRQVLGLSSDPVLRPAEVHDHALRLWGPYPALVHESEDEYDTVVQGSIYDVPDQDAAGKLQTYETENYTSKGCIITVKEGDEEHQVHGWTFKFVGSRDELSRGTWDLDQWRRRTGRMPVSRPQRKAKSRSARR